MLRLDPGNSTVTDDERPTDPPAIACNVDTILLSIHADKLPNVPCLAQLANGQHKTEGLHVRAKDVTVQEHNACSPAKQTVLEPALRALRLKVCVLLLCLFMGGPYIEFEDQVQQTERVRLSCPVHDGASGMSSNHLRLLRQEHIEQAFVDLHSLH